MPPESAYEVDHIIPEYPGRRPVVLVADDDSQIRKLIIALLQEDGHQVLSAADGLEALEISRESPGPIDLVITDVEMPRLNGIELCTHLLEERLGIKLLVMSGAETSATVAEEAEFAFLPKPLDILALRAKVRAILADSVQLPMH